MFHPGIVMQIFSPGGKSVRSSDTSTQVLLQMWDDNIQTVGIDQRLATEAQPGDVVLVDYTQNNPRIAVKIVRGNEAKKLWEAYKKYYEVKVLGNKGAKPIKLDENYIR